MMIRKTEFNRFLNYSSVNCFLIKTQFFFSFPLNFSRNKITLFDVHKCLKMYRNCYQVVEAGADKAMVKAVSSSTKYAFKRKNLVAEACGG